MSRYSKEYLKSENNIGLLKLIREKGYEVSGRFTWKSNKNALLMKDNKAYKVNSMSRSYSRDESGEYTIVHYWVHLVRVKEMDNEK